VAELGAIHLVTEHTESCVEQPIGILVNESVGETSKAATRGPVQNSNQSEVVEADLSLGSNEEVAGVRVAVEDAENEDLM
jgi:hypothetical protein